MLLSAVSLGYCLLLAPMQVGQLSPREKQIWQRMEPSVVTLLLNGTATGPAALISTDGYFVAHRNAVLANEINGKTFDGRTIHFVVKGQDSLSQLVLLKTGDWASSARPFTAPDGPEKRGGTILAVLADGPIRAEFVDGNRVGVVKPSRRLIPLNEFRFEAPAQLVGTALVLSENGELVGALHATLDNVESTSVNTLARGLVDNQGGGINNLLGNNKIGPASLTVAYTAGAKVVDHAIQGFLTPSHRVQYASLGVMCSDAVGGGALIQQVTPKSAAAIAGIKTGDTLLDMGGRLIRNQVDFAQVMLDLDAGKKVTIRVRRGTQILLLDAVLTVAD